jgi:C1A family cysteine protease
MKISVSTIVLILIIIIALIALLIGTGLISYRVGKNAGMLLRPIDAARPVNTYLFYEAPPEVQEELTKSLRSFSSRNIPLPDFFDARQKWPGSIEGALDQGTCGSCWAFASAQAIADRFRISDPDNRELREQMSYTPYVTGAITYTITNTLSPYELVYCDICELTDTVFPIAAAHLTGKNKECEQGCDGGYISHTYQYIAEYGLRSMKCLPPTCNPMDPPGGKQYCDCPLLTEQNIPCEVYIPRFVYMLFSDSNLPKEEKKRIIMEDLYTYGTVTVTFETHNSFGNFFAKNPNGVYGWKDRTPGDYSTGGHAVNIIGWGTDEETGIFYWICRNSWGPYWGNNGFFKIEYDMDKILEPVHMGARI